MTTPHMPDIETMDSELRLPADLRRAARERGEPLLSIDEASARHTAGGMTGLKSAIYIGNSKESQRNRVMR